ncbi:tail fiber assembly protein [Limnobaculum xujianqingii]|uniref:tail fiber assembly protein n=1 Tax=Limnobaculum xujianqingii TaxID=2738837 RepID=UPI00112A1595|nr:tail fiber assembly protein [Limnobaculum xujianqingii]
MIYYSKTTNAFYLEESKENYETAGTWPADVVDVPLDIFSEFSGSPPEGKIRAAGEDGLPVWQATPSLTKEQLLSRAEEEKQHRIITANEYINNKQWPGKAAIGRLKDNELIQYNLWLDHLDELEATNTSGYPDIDWSTPPET